ncbi:unnamed protein product [Vicia faba]|uniref:Uncharacterized protein n=1 Tax=Vicia faba TaxID=3906 RepID=A0AAV0ZEG9_VICFA|nr:unnamed protein product [Vicia faba]
MNTSLLFSETHSKYPEVMGSIMKSALHSVKTFASVVCDNICNIPLSQLTTPCLKGDRLEINIPEEEYNLGETSALFFLLLAASKHRYALIQHPTNPLSKDLSDTLLEI